MASSLWPVFVDTVEDIAIAIAPPLIFGIYGMLALWLSALLARGLTASLRVFTAYWAIIFLLWGAIGVIWVFVVMLFSIVFNSTFITVDGAASTVRTGLEHHVFNKKHHHHHGGKKKKKQVKLVSSSSDDNYTRNLKAAQLKTKR
jgi:hypothetical protein